MANTVVSVSYVGDATTSVMRSWGTCADTGPSGSTNELTAAATTATANAAIQKVQECRFTVAPHGPQTPARPGRRYPLAGARAWGPD